MSITHLGRATSDSLTYAEAHSSYLRRPPGCPFAWKGEARDRRRDADEQTGSYGASDIDPS